MRTTDHDASPTSRRSPRRWDAGRAFGVALGALALLVVVSGSLAGCRGEKTDEADAEERDAGPPQVPVEVDLVTTGDMERFVSGSTTLRSAVEVAVVSEIAGRVTQVNFEVGDTVTAGDVVARVENDEVDLAIREARHNVERFERELASLQPLFDRGYLSRQAWDEIVFQRDQARAQLSRIDRQRGQQTVRAPRGGLVIGRSVEVGSAVVPNQTLLQLADPTSLEARIAVPERELAVLRTGQTATVTIDALGGAVARAVVDRLDPTVDPQSGTIGVRVTLQADAVAAAQPDAPTLRPGMFVTVRVTTDVRPGVPVVPKRAVVFEADEGFVFRVVDGEVGEGSDAVAGTVAERVRVRTGYESATLLEVLDGLAVGDAVIVAGQSGLADGSAVRVTRRVGETTTESASAVVTPTPPSSNEGSAAADAAGDAP